MKRILNSLVNCFLAAVIVYLLLPFVFWLLPCGGPPEQEWLDREIAFLQQIHDQCEDEDLREVLAYTIRRYNKIGPWDVAIVDCWSPDYRLTALGANEPWCPGIRIDPIVLSLPLQDGAETLVHEALHDYAPWFGHSHVDPRIRALLREIHATVARADEEGHCLQLASRRDGVKRIAGRGR